MLSQTSLGILSATLSLASVAPLHAAPAASAGIAIVSTATYHVERHGSQVTVKDANEKTLVTCTAATPTIQCVFARNKPSETITPRSKKAFYQPIFTLEDQNGRHLWSTLVPVVSPTHFQFVYNVDITGIKILLDNKPSDTSPADQHQPSASRLFIILGADGRPLSAGDNLGNKFALTPTGGSLTDPDGKVLFQAQGTPNNGAIFTGPDGMGGSVKTTNTGAIINLNGTKFVIKKVTKNGKTYSSFPWNGHNVMVDQSCTLGFTSDGDLTVDVSSTAKTAASK